MVLAPLMVPVELQRLPARGQAESGLRCFRLAVGLDADGAGLRLRSALPAELCEGPLRVRFHLPPPTESTARLLGVAWEGEVTVTAKAGRVILAAGTERERSEALLVLFQRVPAPTQERLRLYATLRLDGE